MKEIVADVRRWRERGDEKVALATVVATPARWGDFYRGRASVERAFGRLKNEYGLKPLRVRGLERVALHADLCILATLASALARARSVPLAA